MSKLIVGDVETTSINGGPLAGFRNAIINGNFDIWQRGTSFSANQYSADRWIHYGAVVSGTVTQSLQSFALGQTDVPNEPTHFYRIQGSSYTMTAGNVTQKIEGVRTFAGQTVTVSFYAKASAPRELGLRFRQVFDGSATVDTTASPVSLTTSWQKFIATVSIPSIAGETIGANSRLELTFDIKEGDFGSNLNSDSIDIAQVQLEAGSVATPFERRPVGTELALCQRYYQVVKGSRLLGVTYNPNGDTRCPIRLVTSMRTTPSVSYSGGTSVIAFGDNASVANVTLGTLSVAGEDANAIGIFNISNNGAFSGLGTIMSWGDNGGGGPFFYADAEL